MNIDQGRWKGANVYDAEWVLKQIALSKTLVRRDRILEMTVTLVEFLGTLMGQLLPRASLINLVVIFFSFATPYITLAVHR